MLGTIPKTFSNDTLDMSSVDSMSLDEHIEIKIPESRAKENRLMAQNNFVQHINEKTRNSSHTHLAVEHEVVPKNFSTANVGERAERDEHLHRSHSHASVRRLQGPAGNGVGHMANGHDHREHNRMKKLVFSYNLKYC